MVAGTAEDKVRCLIKNYYDMGESHIEDVECKEEIFGVLKEQAEDIRLAPIVRKECQKDIVEFCSDVQVSISYCDANKSQIVGCVITTSENNFLTIPARTRARVKLLERQLGKTLRGMF